MRVKVPTGPQRSLRRPRFTESERPSVGAVIASCPLFSSLTPEEVGRLSEVSFMAFAERGDLIWRAGNPAQFAGVVASGCVKLTQGTPYGSEVAVEVVVPPMSFGAVAVVGDRRDALSAIAVANTWYLKVPCGILLDLYREDPAFRDQVFQSVLPRLRRAHVMMAALSEDRPDCRIATALLLLAETYGVRTSQGTVIQDTFNEQTLSELAAATLETTVQTIVSFEQAGVIRKSKTNLTILDMEPLYRKARLD